MSIADSGPKGHDNQALDKQEFGITPLQAARDILRRDMMVDSLIGYSQGIDIPGSPLSASDDALFQPIGSDTAEHHELLMQLLQETYETEYGRAMIFMPPGSAKSTYGTVVGPTWYMGKYPGSEIILASHNVELAKKHGGRGRNIVQQPSYMAAFGTTISKATTAKENWSLENGSAYLSFGMISGATGNRADGLVIDDPTRGRADAESETMRKKVWDAYRDDLLTRLKPRAWVVIIQTRWAYEDLAGMILPEDWNGESGPILCRDGMMWNVLCLRAKIENEVQAQQDPLKRKVGEYIWPQWFDDRHWLQYEPRPGDPYGPDEKSWASLFQQQPRPDSGNEWEYDWVQWYDLGDHPRYLMLFSASDYALTDEYDEGGNPDFTEHGIAGLDEHGDLWVIDWWYGRTTPDKTIDALLMLCKRHNVRNGFGESGLIERAIRPALKSRQRTLGHHVYIKYLPTIGDKVARFQNVRTLGAAGKVHIPRCPWGERLVAQMCDFPGRSKDDGVDVMSLFGRGLEGMIWSREKVTRPKNTGIVFGSVEWMEYNDRGRKPVEHGDHAMG